MRGGEPPCDDCFVDLIPENRVLIRLYDQVCGQLTDNGELLITAVKIVMDLYQIKNQDIMLSQLMECNRICRSIQEGKTKGPS